MVKISRMSLSKREMSIDSRSLAIPAVIAITLLSTGAVSMIYEVALIREFTILLGSSFYSGAIVLSAIMGGLAIGNVNTNMFEVDGGGVIIPYRWVTAIGDIILMKEINPNKPPQPESTE
ncbi:MAG: hypothetical protein SVK08_05555 [Halobacteriota archaeon]|nr:hypothetical protein [Halobacteriota archaeon]